MSERVQFAKGGELVKNRSNRFKNYSNNEQRDRRLTGRSLNNYEKGKNAMTPLCMTTQEGVAIDDCDEAQKNVLLVDDDQYLLFSMVRHLRKISDSINIYTAANGKQARSILSTVPVDLVISDVKMPVMDGMELALWLSESRPQIPAIMMSGCANPETVASLIRKGYSFIEKPVDQKKLFDVVQSLLSGRPEMGVKPLSRSTVSLNM